MRAARPTVALALLLAAGALSPGLASAATSRADATQIVRGLNELPADLSYGVYGRSCTNPGTLAPHSFGSLLVRTGPAPVPLGSRTWGFAASGAGGAIGPYRSVAAIDNVTTAQMQVYAETGGADGVGYAQVLEGAGGSSWWGVTSTFHVAAGAWTTADVVGDSFSWREFDGSGIQTAQTFSGTVHQMVAHVGSDHGGLIGVGLGCGNGDVFHFDDARFGATGDVLTLDLEAPRTATSIHGSATAVVAGSPVELRGVTTEVGGTQIPKGTLTLQARRFDATRWRDAGTATEVSGVPATLRKRPLVKTDYRWVFTRTAAYDPSASHAFTVRVHTAVIARAADTTVRRGGTIKVTGHVTPAKPGAVVTLFRGSQKVGTAVVRPTGTYTLTTKARSTGLWKLHVSIGATRGNLAGSSKVVTVKVG
jgi:hypothetical protein